MSYKNAFIGLKVLKIMRTGSGFSEKKNDKYKNMRKYIEDKIRIQKRLWKT